MAGIRRREASGESCKAYGAGGIVRLPGRLRITWVDDRTLKLETEAGHKRGCSRSLRPVGRVAIGKVCRSRRGIVPTV